MENVTKVNEIENAEVAVCEKPKHNWLTKGSKFAKKAVMLATIASCMAMTGGLPAHAAGGVVDTSTFITTACTVLKSVISLIGGGVSLWGIVNLLEGYGNDNAGAKSQGMKQLMAGLGLILLAIILVPVLQNMMTGAV